MMGWISFIVVGAIGGWLAGFALHRNTALNIMDVVLGVIGAVVGGWLAGLLLNISVESFSIMGVLAAFVGAVLVAVIYEKVTGKSSQ